MVIRKATLDDDDELCRLIAEVDELHRVNLPQRFKAQEGSTHELGYCRSLIMDKSAGFLVAEDDGELGGFVHVAVPTRATSQSLCTDAMPSSIVSKSF